MIQFRRNRKRRSQERIHHLNHQRFRERHSKRLVKQRQQLGRWLQMEMSYRRSKLGVRLTITKLINRKYKANNQWRMMWHWKLSASWSSLQDEIQLQISNKKARKVLVFGLDIKKLAKRAQMPCLIFSDRNRASSKISLVQVFQIEQHLCGVGVSGHSQRKANNCF